MTNDLKLKIYPAVIAILGLGLVALLLSRFEIQVTRQSPLDLPLNQPSDRSIDPATDPAIEPPERSPAPATASPTPTPLPTPLPSQAVLAPAGAQGGLRVSNQTAYPVRVALLYQQLTEQPKSEPPQYKQPVHWDFAPEEGRAKGLILSLPAGGLRLGNGDVLVAFAQDGSRRYWGPYVVGKTELPLWSRERQEWELTLR